MIAKLAKQSQVSNFVVVFGEISTVCYYFEGISTFSTEFSGIFIFPVILEEFQIGMTHRGRGVGKNHFASNVFRCGIWDREKLASLQPHGSHRWQRKRVARFICSFSVGKTNKKRSWEQVARSNATMISFFSSNKVKVSNTTRCVGTRPQRNALFFHCRLPLSLPPHLCSLSAFDEAVDDFPVKREDCSHLGENWNPSSR